jgi:hypothetical protein
MPANVMDAIERALADHDADTTKMLINFAKPNMELWRKSYAVIEDLLLASVREPVHAHPRAR